VGEGLLFFRLIEHFSAGRSFRLPLRVACLKVPPSIAESGCVQFGVNRAGEGTDFGKTIALLTNIM
jgi:hypothetical protein